MKLLFLGTGSAKCKKLHEDQIPEGASVMTITFTDGGDGATCDNVSLAMPGWVK